MLLLLLLLLPEGVRDHSKMEPMQRHGKLKDNKGHSKTPASRADRRGMRRG